MLENGKTYCTCPKTQCKFHGKCAECIAAHKDNPKNPLAYCKRETVKE